MHCVNRNVYLHSLLTPAQTCHVVEQGSVRVRAAKIPAAISADRQEIAVIIYDAVLSLT